MSCLLSLFFIVITLLFVHVPICVLATDDKYEYCSATVKCGDLDISYPFWVEDRSEYCGYTGFKLEDCNSGAPQITIAERTYRVLHIDYSSKIVNVSIQDYWDNRCPTNLGNTPLNFTLFDYTSDTQNITLYYGCHGGTGNPPSLSPYQFNCSSDDTNTVIYFVTSSSIGSVDPAYLESCGNKVSVAVWQSTVDSIGRNRLSEYINQVFREGFGLRWNANNTLCDRCARSKGLCGHDSNTGEFTCYCPDRPYPDTCHSSKGRNFPLGLVIGIVAAATTGIIVAVFMFFIIRKRRKIAAQLKTKDLQTPPTSKDKGTSTTKTSLSQSIPFFPFSKSDLERGMSMSSAYFGTQVFSYTELEQATDNFHPSKELGDGGFGTVYHGVLKDGRVVAVKRLYENNLKRVEQFMNEVEILATLRHPNLVTLFGCTSRHSRELLLVYEFIPNGTVADHIHGRNSNSGLLTWPVRLSIAVETANALAFLHTSDVIHRDVKTNNILLDNNFRVKVADFGLSRLFPTDVTHVSTAPQGTPGYVDPEYYKCYQLTDKSDVFSFGVVLVELISSLEAVDISRHRHDINLSNMAVSKIQNCALNELVDPSLGFEKDYAVRSMVTSVAELAFRCLQQDRDIRPSMQEVVEVLKGIQNEQLGAQKAEVVDISTDDGAFLKNAPPPISPDSAGTDKRVSCPTASNSF